MPVKPPRDRRPRRPEPRVNGQRVLGEYSDDDAAYLLAEAGKTPTTRTGVLRARQARGIKAYRDK